MVARDGEGLRTEGPGISAEREAIESFDLVADRLLAYWRTVGDYARRTIPESLAELLDELDVSDLVIFGAPRRGAEEATRLAKEEATRLAHTQSKPASMRFTVERPGSGFGQTMPLERRR